MIFENESKLDVTPVIPEIVKPKRKIIKRIIFVKKEIPLPITDSDFQNIV